MSPEVLKTYLLGPIPLLMLCVAMAVALSGVDSERRHRLDVTDRSSHLYPKAVDFIAALNAELGNRTVLAGARTMAAHDALWGALATYGASTSTTAPDMALLRQKERTMSDVLLERYASHGVEALAATFAVTLDGISATTHQTFTALVVTFAQMQHADYEARRRSTVTTPDAYLSLMRARYTTEVANGLARLTMNITSSSPSGVPLTLTLNPTPATMRAASLLQQAVNANTVPTHATTNSHGGETVTFSIAIGLCVVGAFASIASGMWFQRATAVSLQLVQDFSSSDTARSVLTRYRDAFQTFNFTPVASGNHTGSTVEAAFQRVVGVLRQIRPFLPQTLKLPPDTGMSFRNVAVATIRVVISEEGAAVDAIGKIVEVVSRVAAMYRGTIHCMHGTTITVVWNATTDVDAPATAALHGSLDMVAELDQESVSIGLSCSSVLMCNVKTHKRRHVSLIGTAIDSAERLQELASLREIPILFDQEIFAALPRGGTRGVNYRPVCVVRAKDDTELVAYATYQSTELRKEQINMYNLIFSLYHGRMYAEAAVELKTYTAQYGDDEVGQWLLKFVDVRKPKSFLKPK